MTTEILPTIDEIRAAIHNRPYSVKLEDIAKKSQVSLPWLKKVISGEIKEPSYQKISAVYKFLTSK